MKKLKKESNADADSDQYFQENNSLVKCKTLLGGF